MTGDAGHFLRLEDVFSRKLLPQSAPVGDVLLACPDGIRELALVAFERLRLKGALENGLAHG